MPDLTLRSGRSSTATVVASEPRAGRRRDGEVRLERRRRLRALADRRVDVVHHRRGVGGDQVGDLGGVDARAAADGDEAVDLVLEREVGGVLERVDGRLDAAAVVDDDLDALGLDRARARARRCPARRRCGSVTSRTRRTSSRLSSQPASSTAPGPNLTGVASSVNTVSVAMRIAYTHGPRRALAEVVGAAHALDDPDLTAGYETDWTGRFTGRARGGRAARRRPTRSPGRARVRRGGRGDRPPGRQHRARRRRRPARRRGPAVARRGSNAVGDARRRARPGHRRAPARRSPPCATPSPTPGSTSARATRDHRRHRRLRRRRRPGAAPRDGARAGRGRRGGARRRLGRLAGSAALLKDNAGYDLPQLLVGSRGDARRHHRRALEDRPAAAQARRRAARRRRPRPRLLAALRTPSLEACDFFTARVRARTRPASSTCSPSGPPTTTRWRRSRRRSATARRRSPTTPPPASGCGRCARASRSASSRSARPCKLDVGVPLAAPRGVPRRRARGLRRRGRPTCSATSATATSTSTSSATRPTRTPSCRSSSSSAARSPPSTASASPRPPGSSAPAAPRRSRAMRAIKDALDPQGILNPGVLLSS